MRINGLRKIIFTGGLIMVMVLVFSIKVKCSTIADEKHTENTYMMMETQLRENVREYLERNGYVDSGIMLTKVIDTDGSREYTLTVHNKRIDNLLDEEKQEILSDLASYDFEDVNCSFVHEFLILD